LGVLRVGRWAEIEIGVGALDEKSQCFGWDRIAFINPALSGDDFDIAEGIGNRRGTRCCGGGAVALGDATGEAASGDGVPPPIDDVPVEPVCATCGFDGSRSAPANRLASATAETPPITLAINVRREKASAESGAAAGVGVGFVGSSSASGMSEKNSRGVSETIWSVGARHGARTQR
jgi:hypothetical protein